VCSSDLEVRDQAAIAWVDISTGMFNALKANQTRLGPELARLSPSELIIPQAIENDLHELVTEFGISLTGLSGSSFDSTSGEKRLCDLFGVNTLDAYGNFDRAEIAAMGAIVDYLNITQKGKLPLLQPPQQEQHNKTVQIDAATRRNLELTQALSGGRAGSLLAVIDTTVTAGGARLLERRLSAPSRVLETVSDRLNAVSHVLENTRITEDIREKLRQVPDLDRALSRLSLDRGGPRDLTAIRNGLTEAELIATNGPLPRTERSWIASAVSSLPVPDSPEMNTLASVFATLRIVLNSCCIASQLPIIPCSPIDAA
jgi:DNA mismatch repair protein MutS